MTSMCLLHTRHFRSAYEEMVNKLELNSFKRHQVSFLRTHQRELCTCYGPACPEPAVRHQVIVTTPDTSAPDLGAWIKAKPDGWAGSSKKKLVEEAAHACQHRLTALATKRGQFGTLAPAIDRLNELVMEAFTAPEPVKAGETNKPKNKTAGGRISKLVRRNRHYFAPRGKVLPPSKPYAPLRWPPLRFTMAALRGAPLPGAAAGTSPPSGPAGLGPSVAATAASAAAASASVSDLDEEEFSDLVDRFEEKLGLTHHARRHKARLPGGHGRLAEYDVAPSAHCLGEPPVHAHAPPERAPKNKSQDREAWARKQQRRQQQRQQARGPKLRDSERALGGSKSAVPVAQLWPYR